MAWAFAATALFGAIAPAPAQAPVDHVYDLAKPWACRTVEGVLVRQAGARDGENIVVPTDVERNGKHQQYEDRYEFDRTLGRWHVQSGLGGFSAAASPWIGDTWVVQAENADHRPVRMTTELLPGGDFRRTFAYDNSGRGAWFAYSVERCTVGATPPAADACIAQRYPATTLVAEPVKPWLVPPNAPSGSVQVLVSLDENSRITETRVLHSDALELNMIALATTRASRFRTAIVNCKPVAASYIFTVTIN
jgi:hypothetical protein